MEFIVKSNQRWDNGSYYKDFYFGALTHFFNNAVDQDEEVDYMLDAVANLNINQSFAVDFFGGNSYTFKRTI
jgi:hypothetical protein